MVLLINDQIHRSLIYYIYWVVLFYINSNIVLFSIIFNYYILKNF